MKTLKEFPNLNWEALVCSGGDIRCREHRILYRIYEHSEVSEWEYFVEKETPVCATI